MIDAELTTLYGVTTKALNQAVKRNPGRFPEDFMFHLTEEEKTQVVTNCDHLHNLRFSRTRPYAFSEQGVAMLSSVLNSERAVQVNVQIMRTFVRLRHMLAGNSDLARKLADLESKYDRQFKAVFDAIRQLMAEPAEPRKPPIGYMSQLRKSPRK